MNVLVWQRAARVLFDEVQRWVEDGIRRAGTPLESIVYPLSALLPAAGHWCPLEPVGLGDIRTLVVAGAAIPPDSVKAFSPANCHFQPLDAALANREFNAQIDEFIARQPRLSVCSKLHSHPFDAPPFLSGGDLHHGVHSESARRWRQARGLTTAILHLVYPDGEPCLDSRAWQLVPEGALSGRGRHRVLWRLRTWGSTDNGEMEDLGDAELVSAGHASVRAALRAPYWATRRGARWCDGQKAALRQEGFGVSRNLLGRGWRRYLVLRRQRAILIALPPDLPHVPPRVLLPLSPALDRFEATPLPPRVREFSTLANLSLLGLAQHFLGH